MEKNTHILKNFNYRCKLKKSHKMFHVLFCCCIAFKAAISSLLDLEWLNVKHSGPNTASSLQIQCFQAVISVTQTDIISPSTP